jgi:hypothetical protein
MGEIKIHTEYRSENLKGRGQSEDTGVDWKMTGK